MKHRDQLYTLGVWTVKAGQESTFVAEWDAFAKWTAKSHPAAGDAYLLKDAEHPQQFISFGPWDSPEAVKAWRERPEFKVFVRREQSADRRSFGSSEPHFKSDCRETITLRGTLFCL